ncbi:MAG: flavin reductase [Coriobacteriaceae bacterium]|nr:flavin reductase [Coriobacteriaceae bacterium]MCI7439037.1 flavin reductase [Coriobacteriaceae bacterium]
MDAKALFSFSYGLYVVSANDGKGVGACLINTALQVTSDPMQVAVTINKENHTAQVVRAAGHFTLTVVSKTADMPFIGRFGFQSSANTDKFAGIPTKASPLSDPYTTEHACAMVCCAVVNAVDLGTHVMFVGEVVDAERISDEDPMTYAYYHGVLKGKTPPKASSYIKGEDPATPAASVSSPRHHFRCNICGYVHETTEEELPENFRCPACGVGPENFTKID